MSRPAAIGTLNDTIQGERSGAADLSRRTESNNSLNPTRDSEAFIVAFPDNIEGSMRGRVNSGVRPLT